MKTAAGYAGSGLDYQRQLYSPLYDSPQEEGESHLRKNEPAGVFTKVAVGVSKGATENLLICCRKVDYRGTETNLNPRPWWYCEDTPSVVLAQGWGGPGCSAALQAAWQSSFCW